MMKLGRVGMCAAVTVCAVVLAAGCDPVDRDALNGGGYRSATGCQYLYPDVDHRPDTDRSWSFGYDRSDVGTWWDGFGVVVGWSAYEDGAIYATPTDAADCTPYTYAFGDYGQGTPTDIDIAACPGEITYNPATDTWRCESQ